MFFVTAACPKIPPPLLKQLKDEGILVAPVGPVFLSQSMLKIKKRRNEFEEENLGDFVFVPLKGRYGYDA